ncbi:hypothetical protein [Moheibacter sediminis]|uniref:Prolyl-tRNA synthetase n=1 Tax=Moheibacter sediminis TaxID=1434700 RepID=A0A1W2C1Q0_9FLAO|nr:hypothetical protein [Moheibacter sediminis]SMC78934.1 hypothetical protein SAMN06296427_10854 [Moheibacter sediminis]
MNKVYTYPQKIFKSLAALAVIFGVTSCATSQSTAASSGETDGIYYSPSKDGQVQYVSNETPQDYEIKVGGAYFDANGNGAEEFYYEEGTAQETQDVNVYTGSNNIYVASGTTDWGRYDGVDITVNNWGWNDPWMGGWGYGYGFNNWGWGMGWNSWGMGWNWGYPRWGWHNPYWGGGWGYNNWGWGGYPYYGGFYGGYYGGYYGNGYYYRNRVQSGIRPGSNLAYSPFNDRGGNVRRGNSFAQGSSGVRPTRNGNVRMDNSSGVRSNQSNVRPVRTEQPVRNNNTISGDNPVRPTRSEGNVRPVRATVPNEIRQNNTPVRTNNNPVRTNNNQIRTNEPNRSVSPQRNNQQPVRSNQGIQSSPNRGSSNSGGIRSGGGSPSRGSSGGGGGVRSGGGRR